MKIMQHDPEIRLLGERSTDWAPGLPTHNSPSTRTRQSHSRHTIYTHLANSFTLCTAVVILVAAIETMGGTVTELWEGNAVATPTVVLFVATRLKLI